jgi:CSLREA domain-containing protein
LLVRIAFDKQAVPARIGAHTKRRLLFGSRIGTALLFCALAQSASADATFVVNDQTDAVDNNIGDGVCLAANGKCTLRAAIQEANAQYAAHPGTTYTITVPGAVTFFSGPRIYSLTLTGSGEDNAATGDLDIKCNLRLNTTNGRAALVNASGLGDRAFHIIQPASGPINVTLVNVGFENGSVADRGGGMLIENGASSVTLTGLSVLTNIVTGQFAEGGGIDLRGGGTLTLNGVLVRGNRAQGGNNGTTRGGGIAVSGKLIVNASTIDSNVLAENTAADNISGYGAGIDVEGSPGTLDISNSTISNNSINLGSAAQFITGGGINATGTVTITGSTISGNTVSGTGSNSSVLEGGGLYVNGTLTMDTSTVTGNQVTASNQSLGMHGGGVVFNFHAQITNSTIDSNSVTVGTAPAGYGGGISVGGFYYNADLVLDHSVVLSNVANDGGGINIDGGTSSSTDPPVTVRNSSIYYNLATNGSGIFNLGQLTVTNSTFYLNAASKSGGGLYNSKTATVNSTTFYANVADYDATNDGDGGGIFVAGGATQYLGNSVLTGEEDRTASGAVLRDCAGTIISQDYNLIEQTPAPGGCNVIATTTHNKIGPFSKAVLSTTLSYNGGPTPTLELPPGSAAIDAGDDSVLGSPFNLATDQRGFPRKVGAHVDIGALETGPVQAGQTLTVTNTAEHDDGSCTTDDCTLVEAINAANANADVSTINFAPGVSGVILNTMKPNGLSITSPVTINGPGASVLTISGNNASRVFTVSPGAVVNFNGLTIANGSSSTNGGGILNDHGTVTLTNCVVTGNTANFGGGIFNRGSTSGAASLTLNNSTLTANFASGASGKGGGIYNEGVNSGTALLSLTSCTLNYNTTANFPGTAAIENIGSSGTARATLTNCTFNGNAIANDSATLLLANTLLAASSPANLVNTSGTITSQGHNLSSDAAGGDATTGPGGFLNAAGDKRNTDPLLDPAGLVSNGGPTSTIALLSNSPAIDAGDDNRAPSTDQRGYYRSGVSDIGAFEFGGIAATGLVANVSTRLPVGTGDNVLIEGFIVQGPAGSTKKIIVRAIGPSLVAFGITDALPNPTLEIHDANNGNAIVATNDDWKTTQLGGLITVDQSAEIAASGVAPGNDLESAIIANLPPGAYTAVVRGLGNSVGTSVVDAYDLSAASSAKLVNVATRGLIQPGDKLMIAGFIVQNGSVRAVVRAIGPSLAAFGITNALADTTLQLRDGNGAIVVENDDWKIRSNGTSQQAELEATGLQPTDDREAAVVTTLPPGQYTAQVRGKPETTGTGVVQVYFLP